MDRKELIDKILKVRGMSKRRLAPTIGVPYHSLIKTLKPTAFRLKSGEIRFRECRYIREAVARWLGAPYELVWGPGSVHFLRRLLREEVERRAQAETRRQLRALGL